VWCSGGVVGVQIPTWLGPQGVFKKQFRKNIEVLVNLVEILLV